MAAATDQTGRGPASEPTLQVRLLGGLDLRLDDAPVAPLDSARAESLLAYLLLHRHSPQPRQRIAFLLWPDSTEAQARTNLRHVLHTLRRLLPDADRFIEAGPRTLRWRTEAPLQLDVADFERAVADGRLEDAVALYAGDLLEHHYDDWLADERARLAQLYVDSLERLAGEHEQRCDWAGALACAERLLRHDPLREQAHRLLIRLCAACGDRARALRAYHVCAATLQRELGIEPAPATRRLYEALVPDAVEPQGEGESRRPPFVGRERERRRLGELWRSVCRGRARFVLVTGEPGVGKSRLVEELRDWCTRAGAASAEARAYGAEGAVTYGLAAAWLQARPIADRLPTLGSAHLTELARLLPELLERVPGVPAPGPLPEGEQRRRLFAALARAVLAVDVPLLLVADDLHWSDEHSLQFLHHLLRTHPSAPLLVAATARREEVDAGHPLMKLVNAMRAAERCDELELRRFDACETAELAERLTGRRLPAADLARLHDDSEGNPLFLIEALRAGDAGVTATGGATGPKVQAIIAARLGRLSAPAADVAGIAATVGRAFTADVVQAAAGLDEPALVRALDELWRRGIIRLNGPSEYDFSHGRIREAAYAALSPARRRQAHVGVARALAADPDADLDVVSLALAMHHERAGAHAEAVTWYLRAAAAARGLHAYASAAELLERALTLAGRLAPGAARRRLELDVLAELPAPLMALEGYLSDRLAGVHARALRLAGELGVEPGAPVVLSLTLAELTRGDFRAAQAHADELHRRAERDGDELLWVESAYLRGVSAYWPGRLALARHHLEAVVERARPGDRTAQVRRFGHDPELICLLRLAHVLWLLGDHEGAAQRRDAGLRLADRTGDPYNQAVARVWAAIVALDEGDMERLDHHVQTLDIGDATGAPAQITLPVRAFTGLLEILAGREAMGLARLRDALCETRRAPPAPGLPGLIARTLLEGCAAAGDARAGLAAADAALVAGRGAELWQPELRRLRARFLRALGAPPPEVEAELRTAIAVAVAQEARSFEGRARAELALAAGRM